VDARKAVTSTDGPSGRLPVAAPLRPLLPGGLRHGTVATVGGDLPLLLALAAGTPGTWAAVGLPGLGALAAADAGLDLDAGLWADRPGDQWEAVLTTLADAVPVILLGDVGPVPERVARRIAVRARLGGAVILAAGPWPHAQVRLQVTRAAWQGIGQGHGLLTGRRAHVTATARGVGAARHAELWLPGADGKVAAAGEEAGVMQPGRRRA
jgi:hypothetical protein